MDLKPEKDLKYFKRSENRIHLDFLYAIQSRIKEGGNLAGMENATSIPSSEIIVWYDTVCSKDFDFGAAIMLQNKLPRRKQRGIRIKATAGLHAAYGTCFPVS